MMKCLLLTVVVLGALTLCHAGLDTNVCTPGSEKPLDPAKPFPQIPDTFHAGIMMNSAANKTTRNLYEAFDAPNNRAVIMETEATGPYKNISLTGYDIYNFYSNQIVEVINLPDGTFACNAGQLDGRGADTFIFGDDASSATGFTAKTAFMINAAYPPVYKGKKVLDNGISTEVWLDCHYIKALDATVTAEWYFTDETDWTSDLGVKQVPVMLKVKGKSHQYDPQGRVIDQTYTFGFFHDFLTDQEQFMFEIPQGTVCPFLKNFDIGQPTKHEIPVIGRDGYFSFSAELVQQTTTDSGLITDIREFYDTTLKLSRFDFVPRGYAPNFFDAGGERPIREIHDFLAGLSYRIDRYYGNCSIIPLINDQSFDVVGTTGNHVRQKTILEFFGISDTEGSSMNWTYTGSRKIRDITADTYIAERLGFPPNAPPGTKSIWELAFSAGTYIQAEALNIEYAEPLRLYIRVPEVDYEMTYNIYNFDETEPDVWRYDISVCYTDDQKTNVQFKLPGDKKDLMESNRKEFRYFLFADIVGYLNLSPIRISHLDWTVEDDDDANVLVSFVLLDPPFVPGSTYDKLPGDYMVSTADAISKLKQAVDAGSLIVGVGSVKDGTFTQTVAIKGSVTDGPVTKTVTEKVVQLDSGAAAGIGIGFLVVGAAIGVLIIFIVNKVRGQNLPNLSMSFSPKTYENSS